MLVPVLKHAGWSALDNGARAHVWIGTVEDPKVIVAYADEGDGADEGEGEESYVDVGTEWGRSDDMVRRAFANLESHHTGFDLIESEGNRLLISVGQNHVCERALLQSHMLLATEKLDCEEIVVSIARRGLLLVCDRGGGPARRRTMLGAHAEALNSPAVGDLLCADLLVMRHGRVIRTLDVTDPWQ